MLRVWGERNGPDDRARFGGFVLRSARDRGRLRLAPTFRAALTATWRGLRVHDTRWGRWLLNRRAALAALVIGAIVALTFWFADLAYSHDHAEHCFKAYHFWHEMLGRGRLRGWTHFLGFGYPSGELTPFGPELWVALFRAATLGLLSWTHTYALAFSSVVVFAVIAIFL